jgi:hypothetical protein
MLSRAWGRALALLFRRAAALVLPNLQASLAMGLVALAWAASVALQTGNSGRLALKIFSAWTAWMAFSWLCRSARAALEEPNFRPGPRELKGWLISRLAERSLSLVAALAGLAWIILALGFYRDAAGDTAPALAALLIIAAMALAALAALALNFALSSRRQPALGAEWKASFLMALAFAPQTLGALAGLFLLSGAGVFLTGTERWWGRLLWAPALALPVFGAALAAAFLVALSDEFLARSRGAEPPAYEPFKFKELMHPWR